MTSFLPTNVAAIIRNHCFCVTDLFVIEFVIICSPCISFLKDGSFHTRGFVQINNLKTLSSIVSFDQEKLTDENLKLLEVN